MASSTSVPTKTIVLDGLPQQEHQQEQPSHRPQQQQLLIDISINDNSISMESIQWDLSNLCSHDNTSSRSASAPSTRMSDTMKHPFSSYPELEYHHHYHQHGRQEYSSRGVSRRFSHVESSLYPNEEELLATSLADCNVEDIFSSSDSSCNNNNSFHLNEQITTTTPTTVTTTTQLRRNTSDSLLNSTTQTPTTISSSERSPGAFYSSTSNLTNKPPKPSWVDKSTQLEQKIELQHRKPANNSDDEPPIMMEDGEDRYGYNKATCTSSSSSTTPQKYPPRPEVEVSPGVYMPLRGTDETIQAIEAGRGKLVFCLACSTALQCVPDCDLVICPDCRVFSPVPKFVDDNYVYDRDEFAAAAAAVAGLEEDDRCGGGLMMVQLPPQWIGGVGLGLKVSFLD